MSRSSSEFSNPETKSDTRIRVNAIHPSPRQKLTCHARRIFLLGLAQIVSIVSNHDDGRNASLLLAACGNGLGDVLVVPLHSLAHRAVISVIDGLAGLSWYVCLLSKFVEEDIEALALVLGERDQTMIERQGPVFDFLEYCLENNDIMKGGFNFEQIHSSEKSIGVWHEILAIGKML